MCRVAEHYQQRLQGHTQEVVGLRWAPDASLLASGGNDNKVRLRNVDLECSCS